MEITSQKNKVFTINFQEAPMSLFRDGFKLEKKSQEGYMKLQKGDNKIRILSQFIDGWEEWEEKDGKRRPVRYKEKPEEASSECKQFVTAIVWNYSEKRIQILQLIQSSVIRKIASLAEDQDWGPVWFYDIKITRTGEDKMTRYEVNPLPRKPLAQEIEKAFIETPINLEAMFTGEDPFQPGSYRTPGTFKEPDFMKKEPEDNIDFDQQQEILDLIGNDQDFLKEFRLKLERAFGSSRLADIPKSQFAKVKVSVSERLSKAV